jgi:serine/threonine protein kinase
VVADAIAAADRRPTPFPGGGRYEILSEIGRGGMGVVYRARDKRLDRLVALKRLTENLRENPRAVELLLREARSAARLSHPNLVTIYDVDHEDGSYFITMELLEGQPLSTLLGRRGRLAPRAVTWLGQQAAAGLSYAHERQIVHRDVKTANLFLTVERVLKIMDFGLAKMVEAVRRRATRIGGTPAYIAPEQSQGLLVDGRTDLYGLGATLFELLTGAPPFDELEGDPMHHHRETPPPDPRARSEGIPDELAALVLQLLAKHPDERPASAAEVAARLRAIETELGGEELP